MLYLAYLTNSSHIFFLSGAFSVAQTVYGAPQVRLTSLGISQTLLTVEGSCQGMELRLDVSSLPFGSVAAYSRVKRNVCIINDGDIGARYRLIHARR